jgi:hypothetical protein
MVNVIKKMKGNKLSSRMCLWMVISLAALAFQVAYDVVVNSVIEPSGGLLLLIVLFAVASEIAEEIESLKEDK